ncbi:MAG: hypothetical protein PUK48_02515 [Spirochaetales bacterium]|nr:hypothetical protein [Spirochaetales bacterium]
MKKLLSVFAAAAVLFGLVSCDNLPDELNMHDSAGEFEGYSITGEGANGLGWNGAGDYALVRDGDVYTVDLVAASSKIIFCFVKTGGAWTDQINGDVMTGKTLPAGITYEAVDNNNGGFNATLNNLVTGASYTLKVSGNPTAVEISLDGPEGVDPATFYTLFYTEADGSNESKTFENADKRSVMKAMAKGSDKYTFSFIALADETLKYKIDNLVVPTLKETEYSLPVEKNTEYEITVDAKTFAVTEATIDLLKNVEVISNNAHDYDFYAEGNQFVATRSEILFYVNRKAGNSSFGWGNKETLSVDANGDGSVTLSYVESKKDPEANAVKITGLKAGTCYALELTEDSDNKIKATISLVLPYSFEGAVLKGGWEGWWQDSYTMTADAIQEFEVTASGDSDEHPASGNKFGMYNPDNNWKLSNLELGTRTEMEYSETKVDDCTLKDNWEKGATYTIKIELTDDTPGSPKAFITITKKSVN